MIQASSTLRYRVIEGTVELTSLRILESRVLAWAGMEVTVRILGASHAVSITANHATITELLTCAGPEGGGRLLAEAGIRSDVCVAAHGMVCRASIRPVPFASGTELTGRFRPDSVVQAEFPRSPGLPAPVTRVGWRAQQDCLLVESVHTYPEEGIAVRSETRFEPEAIP